MGTLDQLDELDLIKDPILKAKRKAEIIQSMLGKTYARASVSPIQLPKPPTASVGTPRAVGPTVKDADNLMYLHNQIDMADSMRAKRGSPAAAYTDEELATIFKSPNRDIEDPNNLTGPEIVARAEIDKQSLPRKLVNPTYLNRLSRNVVASTAESVHSSPLALAGILTNIPKYFGNESIQSGDEMLKASMRMSNKIRNSVGITQPRDKGETGATILGGMIPVAGPGPTSTLANMAEIATPYMIGTGPGRVAANFAVGMAADTGMREASDVAGDPYKTITDQLGITGGADDAAYPAVQAFLGTGLALGAGAGIVAPIMAKGLRQIRPKPPVLPIEIREIDIHGPRNLKTLERAGDLYGTYITDAKEPLTKFMQRAQVPDWEAVSQRIDGETGLTATVRTNYAMKTGRLETLNGGWHVDMTPDAFKAEHDRLPPQMKIDADAYLKYNHHKDVLQKRIADPKNPSMDADIDRLVNVKDHIRDIRERFPLADQFLNEHGRIIASVRDFLAQGPNAMIGPNRKLKLETDNPHFVPTDIVKVDPDGNIVQRMVDDTAPTDQRSIDNYYRMNPTELVENIDLQANAFEMLPDFVHNALKAKMQNDATGAYITAMKNSPLGKDTIRLATKRELKDPLQRSRLLRVYEEGKPKTYITSQLTANLARFDPHIVNYPFMYTPKRIIEMTNTGPLSPMFAPVTMMRDTIGGWITKEPGMLAANPFEVIAAVPEQIIGKAKVAAVQMLQQNDFPFIQNKDALVDQIGTSLVNSMYETSMMSGGTDASLLRSSLETAKGQLSKSAANWSAQMPAPIKTLGYSARALYKGWEAIFDAMSEAPRFATNKKNVRAGMDPVEAATRSRRITGDATRSGRVYNKYGKRIDADAQNKEGKILANRVGQGMEIIRESAPWVNPMVQGLRRLGRRLIDNPVETNLRAWTAVGLPTLLAMGWNEALGPEYNEYAFGQRTSGNIAGYPIVIGVPGLRPDQSIQLPVPHEFSLYASPWSTAIYSMMRGDETSDMKAMIQHQAMSSLNNAAAIGFPQFASVGMSALGVKPPQSLTGLGWKDEAFTVSEDNVGALPQNAELALRTTFGNITDALSMMAAAAHDGGPEAFIQEMGFQLGKRTPIVKNLIGATGPVSQFTPESELAFKETDAVDKFVDVWRMTYGAGGGENVADPSKNLSDTHGVYDDTDLSTRKRMGPIISNIPTNPVYQMYGEQIKANLDNNDVGYSALKDRSNLFKAQIKTLKAYTAGSRSAFREFQKKITGADGIYQEKMKEFNAKYKQHYTKAGKDTFGTAGNQELKAIESQYGDAAKLDRLIRDNKLDLSKRSNVQWLIGTLEKERIAIRKVQRQLIKTVEDIITVDAQSKGLLPDGVRFDVTKHLGMNIPSDMEGSPALGIGAPPPQP